MKLFLSVDETRDLEKYGSVEIIRDGIEIVVEGDPEYYTITVVNPYEAVVLAKEPAKENKKMKTITILATEFKPTKMHIYDVKTTGKHPVHVIEGGSYITESEEVLDECSDLGWFFLNQ